MKLVIEYVIIFDQAEAVAEVVGEDFYLVFKSAHMHISFCYR